eukprot:scaffold20011_cov33-Tisochrysis_lutea.AAC.1
MVSPKRELLGRRCAASVGREPPAAAFSACNCASPFPPLPDRPVVHWTTMAQAQQKRDFHDFAEQVQRRPAPPPPHRAWFGQGECAERVAQWARHHR